MEVEEPTDLDKAPAMKPPKKKASAKKAGKTPEPPPPEPEEEEDENEELTEDQIRKRKVALSKRRRKAKLVGYRSLAKAAGYVDRSSKAGFVAGDCDGLQPLLTESDAKRLMKFTPAMPGSIGLRPKEFSQRLGICKHGVPSAAARVTQAYCDPVMRAVINQVVMNAVEAGKKTISPSMVQSVLRPYAANMELTSVVPPIGLIRHGQDQGKLVVPEWDVTMRQEDKKQASENKKSFNEYIAAEEKRREEFRAKKQGLRDDQKALLKAA